MQFNVFYIWSLLWINGGYIARVISYELSIGVDVERRTSQSEDAFFRYSLLLSCKKECYDLLQVVWQPFWNEYRSIWAVCAVVGGSCKSLLKKKRHTKNDLPSRVPVEPSAWQRTPKFHSLHYTEQFWVKLLLASSAISDCKLVDYRGVCSLGGCRPPATWWYLWLKEPFTGILDERYNYYTTMIHRWFPSGHFHHVVHPLYLSLNLYSSMLVSMHHLLRWSSTRNEQ